MFFKDGSKSCPALKHLINVTVWIDSNTLIEPLDKYLACQVRDPIINDELTHNRLVKIDALIKETQPVWSAQASFSSVPF